MQTPHHFYSRDLGIFEFWYSERPETSPLMIPKDDSVFVVFSCDCEAEWELLFVVQHHERGS